MDARRVVSVAFCLLAAVLPLRAAKEPLLVCYGDSITAGYGVSFGEAYPDDLQKILNDRGYHYQVINRGTSGATSKDAIAGLPLILDLHPAIVIVEFGGNDGLRGLPPAQTRANLDQVVAALVRAHIQVLVAGITLPPDYGPDYIRAFQAIFPEVAVRYHTALVPMLYKDLIAVPGAIQADGIHPTAKGAHIIADTLFPVLKPLLRKTQDKPSRNSAADPAQDRAGQLFAISFDRVGGLTFLPAHSEIPDP